MRTMHHESMVYDIGRACLREIGYKSRWELVDLLWLWNISMERMAVLGMEYDRNVWKKINVERIKEYGRRW